MTGWSDIENTAPSQVGNSGPAFNGLWWVFLTGAHKLPRS
jgi:hypothetical protein